MNESNQKNEKSPKKKHNFLNTVLPMLIVIGCLVVGVIYTQNPRMWSDLFHQPQL
jgi:hypothetical protein